MTICFKKSRNCLLLVSCLIIIGIWWKGITEIKPTVTLTLKNQNQTYEYGQEIKLSKDDFIKDISISQNYTSLTKRDIHAGLKLKLSIPAEDGKLYPAIGNYSGNITLKSSTKKKVNFHISKNSFNISVQDTTKPQLTLTQDSVTFDYGYSITKENIESLIHVNDLSPVKIEYDLNTINTSKSGSYILQITAKDTSNNIQSLPLTISIKNQVIETPSSQHAASTESKDTVKNDIFILDGNVGQSYIRQALTEWNRIPSSVKQELIDDGWKFYLTAYEIQGRYYNGLVKGTIAGVTKSDSKTIYIKARGNATKRATCHEIGHAFDCLHGYLSSTSEFNRIYQDEQYTFKQYDDIGDGHCTSSASEYFAETFRTYCYSPSTLKSSAPRTYDFLCRYL